MTGIVISREWVEAMLADELVEGIDPGGLMAIDPDLLDEEGRSDLRAHVASFRRLPADDTEGGEP